MTYKRSPLAERSGCSGRPGRREGHNQAGKRDMASGGHGVLALGGVPPRVAARAGRMERGRVRCRVGAAGSA